MRVLKIALKTLSFLIITVVILAAAITLLFYGSGYRFDAKNKKVYRTGLIYVVSNPTRASITLNNRILKKKTPYKIEGLNPGDYHLKIEKDGFTTWQKKLSVEESLVSWAQYVLLLSNDLKSKIAVPKTSDFLIAKNEKRAALITDPTSGSTSQTLHFWDLEKNESLKSFVLPATAGVEWKLFAVSSEGKGAVFYNQKTKNSSDRIWYWTNIDRDKAVNLNTQFGIKLDDLKFLPGTDDQIYFVNNKSLFLLNLSSNTSDLVVSNILGYEPIKDRLLYVAATESGNALFQSDLVGGSRQDLLPVLPRSSEYFFGISNFENTVVIVQAGKNGPVVLVPQKGTSVILGHKPEKMSTTKNGRFLLMYTKDRVWVHDFDELKNYEFEAENLNQAAWLFTNSHLLLDEGGTLSLVDFDGTNRHGLAKGASAAASSLPLKKIFAIEAGSTDQSTSLISFNLERSF